MSIPDPLIVFSHCILFFFLFKSNSTGPVAMAELRITYEPSVKGHTDAQAVQFAR